MKPYIIADTTYNHEGDPLYLLRMIDELDDLKIQAVKFHLLFDIDTYMAKKHPAYKKIKDMLIYKEEWDKIIAYAKARKLDVILLCDDVSSLEYAMDKDVHEIEIHSSGIIDYDMLNRASDYDGNIMLGIGGATNEEIRTALYLFDSPVTLMYGFNGWPTEPKDINLSRMKELYNKFCRPVGYADHTIWNHPDNVFISCSAALSGFNILEKHYTLVPGKERVDYRESVGKDLMADIRDQMNVACGIYGDIKMSESEKNFALKIRKVDGLRR
jgi:N,N'-diacetyllegionaminate synthase